MPRHAVSRAVRFVVFDRRVGSGRGARARPANPRRRRRARVWHGRRVPVARVGDGGGGREPGVAGRVQALPDRDLRRVGSAQSVRLRLGGDDGQRDESSGGRGRVSPRHRGRRRHPAHRAHQHRGVLHPVRRDLPRRRVDAAHPDDRGAGRERDHRRCRRAPQPARPGVLALRTQPDRHPQPRVRALLRVLDGLVDAALLARRGIYAWTSTESCRSSR